MRVLDWGCGIGTAVAELREQGWEASGADIDADAVDRGNEAIAGRPLRRIEHGLSPWPSGVFDFIFSQETFEHVADIQSAVQEIRRLSAPGSVGFHTFPAKFRLVEPHVFVPFLHWFPKNRLMFSYLWVCCHVGIGHSSEVNKRALAGLTATESAAFSYRYMREHTFYRSYRAVCHEFRQAGLTVESPILEHPRLARLARPLSVPLIRPLARFLLLNFVTVQIETHLANASNASG
jgi:SAM-dependent methyltransferase